MAILDNRFLQLTIDVIYDDEANMGSYTILLGDTTIYSSGEFVALGQQTVEQAAKEYVVDRFTEVLG